MKDSRFTILHWATLFEGIKSAVEDPKNHNNRSVLLALQRGLEDATAFANATPSVAKIWLKELGNSQNNTVTQITFLEVCRSSLHVNRFFLKDCKDNGITVESVGQGEYEKRKMAIADSIYAKRWPSHRIYEFSLGIFRGTSSTPVDPKFLEQLPYKDPKQEAAENMYEWFFHWCNANVNFLHVAALQHPTIFTSIYAIWTKFKYSLYWMEILLRIVLPMNENPIKDLPVLKGCNLPTPLLPNVTPSMLDNLKMCMKDAKVNETIAEEHEAMAKQVEDLQEAKVKMKDIFGSKPAASGKSRVKPKAQAKKGDKKMQEIEVAVNAGCQEKTAEDDSFLNQCEKLGELILKKDITADQKTVHAYHILNAWAACSGGLKLTREGQAPFTAKGYDNLREKILKSISKSTSRGLVARPSDADSDAPFEEAPMDEEIVGNDLKSMPVPEIIDVMGDWVPFLTKTEMFFDEDNNIANSIDFHSRPMFIIQKIIKAAKDQEDGRGQFDWGTFVCTTALKQIFELLPEDVDEAFERFEEWFLCCLTNVSIDNFCQHSYF